MRLGETGRRGGDEQEAGSTGTTAHLEVVLDKVELGLERLEAPIHLQLRPQVLPDLACRRAGGPGGAAGRQAGLATWGASLGTGTAEPRAIGVAP